MYLRTNKTPLNILLQFVLGVGGDGSVPLCSGIR